MGNRGNQSNPAQRRLVIGFLGAFFAFGLATSLWAMIYAQHSLASTGQRPWLHGFKMLAVNGNDAKIRLPNGKKYGMRLLPPDADPANADASLQNVVDEYGQNAKANWPGKLLRANDLITRKAQEESALAASLGPPDRDKYGGQKNGASLGVTGFFHTAEHNGKWWLIDPDGHLFFSVGMDAVDNSDTYEATIVTGREAMFSWLPTPKEAYGDQYGVARLSSGPRPEGLTYNFYGANLERKYGADWNARWQATTLARLKAWGFNTLGNWSDEALCHTQTIPYVARLGYPATHAHVPTNYGGWGAMDDPFDPQFQADVAKVMPSRVQRYKNDPYCIGYFLANELSWAGTGPQARYGLAYGALALNAASSPAKQAFVAQLQSKYSSIAALNGAWGTQLASWSALSAPWQAPASPTSSQQGDMGAFVYHLARRWFEVMDGELKKQDAQHLDLGCRFSHFTPEVAQACAEVCDVVSFNVYQPRLETADWAWLSDLHKPCLITEFHSGATDRGQFSGGLLDAGDQPGRAAQYQAFVQSALDNPALVGCQWYAYIDQPLTGTTWDGENGNIGFVDVTDTPYPELTIGARKINGEMYGTRS